jgi:hypothetical protein
VIRAAVAAVRPVISLIEIGFWSFITFRIHPLSDTTRKAVLRTAELRRPTR